MEAIRTSYRSLLPCSDIGKQPEYVVITIGPRIYMQVEIKRAPKLFVAGVACSWDAGPTT